MRRVLWIGWSLLVGCGSDVAPGEAADEGQCERGCAEQEEAVAGAQAAPARAARAEAPSNIGQDLDLGALPGVVRWHQEARGDGALDVVVFFEVWCPHCRNEMPHLSALDAMPGVEVLALTRQSRGVTDEAVESFVEQHDLPFGVAHVDEQLAAALNVRGIPRAVVVKDGKIVWDGHPAKLDEQTLRGWL